MQFQKATMTRTVSFFNFFYKKTDRLCIFLKTYTYEEEERSFGFIVKAVPPRFLGFRHDHMCRESVKCRSNSTD
jgi:hypothetical protein